METCDTKVCNKCGVEKHITEFYRGKNGKVYTCKECARRSDKKRRDDKKHKHFWVEAEWILQQ